MTAMRQSVRDAIDRAPGGTPDNPGLELSRYLRSWRKEKGTAVDREALLDRVARSGPPDGYRRAWERRETTLQALPGAKAAGRFSVQGRLAVGLGIESILENGLATIPQWGMPMIPGSALKGLARHYMQDVVAIGEDGTPDPNLLPPVRPDDATPGALLPPNAHSVIFGTTEDGGYITWHDAWYLPRGTTPRPFRRDVLTPHHPKYQRSRGTERPPSDFDDPMPVPFISVAGDFVVILHGPTQAWVDYAFEVLTQALEHAGSGAKTSSGYGRLKCEETYDWGEPDAPAAPEDVAAAFLLEIAAAPNDDLSKLANPWSTRWAELVDSDQKQKIALVVYKRWQAKPSVLKRVREKTWAQPIIAAAEGGQA